MTAVPSSPTSPKFQFTRPRGARLAPIAAPSVKRAFQFTRPRGARLRDRQGRPRAGGFQFTRPRGARPDTRSATPRTSSFQFTRPRGARRRRGRFCRRSRRFQFTRPRGARPDGGRARAGNQCFNSRAHEGRDRLYFIISYRWTARGISANPGRFLDCFLLLSMIKYFAHVGSVLFFFREHPKGFLSTWGSRSVC